MMRNAGFPSRLPYGARAHFLKMNLGFCSSPISIAGSSHPAWPHSFRTARSWAFFVRRGAGFPSIRLHCTHNAFTIFRPGICGSCHSKLGKNQHTRH